MRITTILAASTALTVLIGGAAQAADDNKAYVEQTGNANQASVTQSGDGNDAGGVSSAILQSGASNRLTILQSGDGNDIGLAANGLLATETGVVQRSAAGTSDQNTLTITQSSNGNTVGSAVQLSGGKFNTATITQGGTGGNAVNSFVQKQSSSQRNIAMITQTGSGNVLDRVVQAVRSGGPADPNEVTVTMSGASNGDPADTLGGFAASSGAETSTIRQGRFNPTGLDQLGDIGNKIVLEVSGDDNQFGLTQLGRLNTVGTIAISGSRNQLGTYQSSIGGLGNAISLAAVGGSDNDIGIRQVGSDNLAGVDVSGDFNQFGLAQTGDANDATVTISGNDNGGGSFTALTPAASVAGGRLSGFVEQISPSGTSLVNQNSVSLTISTNDNQFSLYQNGEANTIDGTIDTGNANQVAVAQVGNGNTSVFTQSGGGNNLGISQ
jgi:hypothetical protein